MTGERPGGAPRAGFTIVELTVSLTIAGLVVLAGYGALASIGDALARARADARPTLAALTARTTLEGWLRAATLDGGMAVFEGRRRLGLDARLDEVAFGVQDAGPLHPGRARVRLYVDRDPTTLPDGLVAEVQAPGRAVAADTIELAPAAIGLAARYRASLAAGAPWLHEWTAPHVLPAVVELRVVAPRARPGRDGEADLLWLPLTVVLAGGGM